MTRVANDPTLSSDLDQASIDNFPASAIKAEQQVAVLPAAAAVWAVPAAVEVAKWAFTAAIAAYGGKISFDLLPEADKARIVDMAATAIDNGMTSVMNLPAQIQQVLKVEKKQTETTTGTESEEAAQGIEDLLNDRRKNKEAAEEDTATDSDVPTRTIPVPNTDVGIPKELLEAAEEFKEYLIDGKTEDDIRKNGNDALTPEQREQRDKIFGDLSKNEARRARDELNPELPETAYGGIIWKY